MRQRRVAVVGTIAVLAAVVASGTFAVAPTPTAGPAASAHAPAIPRDVWEAKSWYPGVRDEPPGQVAVLGGVAHDGGNGLYVVSARTGVYRILDLPRLADRGGDQTTAALSPDGRYVAYWLTGRTAGEPYPDVDAGTDQTPVGVGVYDTETGDVARYLPTTEHGISTDNLVWLDREVLALTHGQRTSRSAADRITTYAWRPFASAPADPYAEPVAWKGRDAYLLTRPVPTSTGTVLDRVSSTTFGVLGPDGTVAPAGRITLPRLDAGSYQAPTRSARYAVVEVQQGDGTATVRYGRIDGRGAVRALTTVEGFGYLAPLGWQREDRLVAFGAPSGTDRSDLYAIDLSTGRSTRLGTVHGDQYAPGLSYATALFAEPMVAGEQPPSLDPRWLWSGGAAAAAVVLALGALVTLRRIRG